jgi:hypothetical protein
MGVARVLVYGLLVYDGAEHRRISCDYNQP